MLNHSDPRDARIVARLREEEYAYLTTVRPDGRPHTVPVCFLWEDDNSILVFSQPNTVKCRNLQHNPYVSLALDSFRPDIFPIVVEGAAALVDESGVDLMMPAYVAKYTPLAERTGMSLEHLAQEFTQAIRITPAKIRQDQ